MLVVNAWEVKGRVEGGSEGLSSQLQSSLLQREPAGSPAPLASPGKWEAGACTLTTVRYT